jgi:hypothetical protein
MPGPSHPRNADTAHLDEKPEQIQAAVVLAGGDRVDARRMVRSVRNGKHWTVHFDEGRPATGGSGIQQPDDGFLAQPLLSGHVHPQAGIAYRFDDLVENTGLIGIQFWRYHLRISFRLLALDLNRHGEEFAQPTVRYCRRPGAGKQVWRANVDRPPDGATAAV